MTVAHWINENKKFYEFSNLVIVDKDNKIILDDRIAYLAKRGKEYNADWKARCRGKQIVEEKKTGKAIVLVIE